MQRSHDDLCILLLEDDDADAYLTKRELLAMPRVSSIVRARNGQEAISLLEAGQVKPDLAFVDLQMPMMDGLEFLSECLSRGLANIPMVVLTSSSARHDAILSRVRGALQVIAKPANVGDLRQALRDAVDAFVPPAATAGDAPVWGLVSPERPVSAGQPAPAAAKTFGRRDPRSRP